VGVFLIVTGFAVSMGIPDDDFTFTLETLRKMFLETHSLILWLLPLFLAVLLRAITHKYHHQLIFPLCTPLFTFTMRVSC
jgi:SulP family sulfate permease